MPVDEIVEIGARAYGQFEDDLSDEGIAAIMAATEHSGDCTKDPWACAVCAQDRYREGARAVYRALANAEYAVVKVPPSPLSRWRPLKHP